MTSVFVLVLTIAVFVLLLAQSPKPLRQLAALLIARAFYVENLASERAAWRSKSEALRREIEQEMGL